MNRMRKSYHTVYLTIIGLLVVTLVWALILRPSNSPQVDRLARVVVIPIQPATSIASIRLIDGLIEELEGSAAVMVELPPDAGAVNFPGFVGDLEDTLVLHVRVSGSDENLRISVILFDYRLNGSIWSDDFVTNIYDLTYLSEEIAGQVVSIASR